MKVKVGETRVNLFKILNLYRLIIKTAEKYKQAVRKQNTNVQKI